MTGAELIAAERARQVEVEGHSLEHDSGHDSGELALAASCYLEDLLRPWVPGGSGSHFVEPEGWPWSFHDWNPTPNDPVRQLVKAGALIAAEIDRLQDKSR